MALRKHSQLLPGVFQTDRNQKFLNATLDQLNSEPNNVRINQYVGRKTSKSFSKGDSYVTESTARRQNYQLEPAVVYRNSAGEVESVDGIVNALNSVGFNSADTTNLHKLVSQQYYNYEGWVDIDKLINYGEYFWLPKGPDVVNVGGSAVDPEKNFTVNRNSDSSSYTFDSDADTNQAIYLARGGEYTFILDQPGFPFWIQTEIGISGISSSQSNVSTRDVVGVVNNGEDDGTVTFRVPKKDNQNFFVNLPVTASVDLATNLTWRTLHNQTLQNILDGGGIDTLTDINGKTVVFANDTDDETEWEQGGLFDSAAFDDDDETFDPTTALTKDERYGIFEINVISISGVDTVTLNQIGTIPQYTKVKIKQGVQYGSRELYKNADEKLELIPPITADNDVLYYRDGVNENMFGRIVLVDIGDAQTINVTDDIIGQNDYTAPNKVVFTNGLKIEFDSTVTPESYQNNTYYIEGVGQLSGICLVPEVDLSTPETFTNSLSEPFDSIGFDAGNFDGTEFAPTDPDYILMNRACRDNNAWSRYNRWFHKSVVEAAAAYNDFTVTVDYTARAKRPIVEYRAGLGLFNHGINAKQPVSIFDITQTDALSNVAGTTGYFSDGIDLDPQMRIVFSADADEDVRKTIYRVDFIDEDGDAGTTKIINLVPVETITEDDCLVAKFGTANQGKMFYFKNSVWNESQQKTQLFQDPLFDIHNGSHVSLSDTTTYPDSTFAGSKLFSYKRNNNAASDSVLGFGLSYKNFNNIGDIVFDNNFITDTFTYTKPSTSKQTSIIVKSGHAHAYDYNTGARRIENGWRKINVESKGFQVVRYEVVDEFYSFEIGCQPNQNNTSTNLKVYINSKFQEPSKYTVLNQNNKYYVVLDTAATADDVVIIKVFSDDITPLGYFEVPVNLENNADNTDFSDLTLGQARNHLIEIGENIPALAGSILGANNMRDIDVGQYAGKILQHSAGAIVPFYLLTNEKANLIDAIKFSSAEYTRFKNKLIDNLDKLDLDLLDAPGSVDKILETQIGSKTNAFPFYYSDMTAWGNQKNIYNYTLDNTTERVFDFGTQFDLVDLSQRSVLVYLTNSNNQKQQLIHGRDYTFDTDVAAVNLDSTVDLAIGDVLSVVEYSDTDGSFVPPTPSKLGLWPAIEPSVYLEQNFGYEDTGTGPYKVYGTLDPEYTQLGQGRLGFVYPLFTTYEAAQEYDTSIGGSGQAHIHRFIGTPQLFYMPNSQANHGAQDDASIPYYPGVRTIVRGHDGSRYVGFGDVRDSIIYEYEARVYNNIKSLYSNDLFDWQEVLTGYARSTTADRKIELDILRSSYGTWAEKNRVDISKNDTFSVTNPFTWNYSQSQNKNTGDAWQGGWRGIYNWLYDTETPHLTPWEMLGQYSKPSWWDQRYGESPYTSGNNVLWEDLRDGKLYSDAISSNYTTVANHDRPQLLDFIPTDEQGQLRPPADFACKDLTVGTANGTWRFGDYSPQETAWRTSSEWPFAAQLLGLLRKPAKYASLLWDTNLFAYDSAFDQILQKNRTYRPGLADYCLHGVADDAGIVSRREGYNQFIFNRLVYNNYNAKDVETRVRNLELNLCYAVGGYTDKNLLKVVAETATPNTSNNTIFVPDENYNIFLSKSHPLERVVYSGVRIVRVENGYKVSGYDNTNPFFKVVPSKKTQNTRTFSIGPDTGFSVFDDYSPYIVNVAYGTVLVTKQQVVDFLNSLQRYYVNKGIIFDNEDGDFIETAKQFVFWSQQGWEVGSVFTVSPLHDRIRINRSLTTLDDLSQSISLRDINGNPIAKTAFKVSRIDNETIIYVNPEETVLASAVLNPIQYEHILVLDNETIFSDLVYQPNLGNRQDRVKLIGQKTGNWNGTLHAPGYIVSDDSFDIWQENKSYNKGAYVSLRNKLYVANQDHTGTQIFEYDNWDLLPNYKSGLLKNTAHRSAQFENFYDIDTLNVESGVDLAGKGLIGFRNREWLENLGLDDVSQVKFYQGLLKGKGTSDVINKLINADLTNLNQEIDFYEEWGFRVGEYGSNDSNQVVEVLVDESNSANNPLTIEFLGDGESVESDENLGITSSDLYKTPTGYTKNLWKTRTADTRQTDLDHVGYVRLDDVDYTVIDDFTDLETQIQDLGRGDKVWIARDRAASGTWNVYRIDETETSVKTVSTTNTGLLNITLDSNHDLAENDYVLVKTDDVYGGVYQVQRITSNQSFQVESDFDLPETLDEIESVPVYKFVSNRFTNLKDLSSYTPLYGFFANELVWVDSDENGRWAAYEKKLPWNQNDVITSTDIAAAGHMGASVSIAKDSSIALVGAPDSVKGRVLHYKTNVGDRLAQASVLKVVSNNSIVDEYGYSVASADVWHAVGAPATNSSQGTVFLYTRDNNNDLSIQQALCTNAANQRFGHSVTISNNEQYMAIGAPSYNSSTGRVYVYGKVNIDSTDQSTGSVSTDGSTTTYAIGFIPTGTDTVLVTDNQNTVYIPNIDYTISSGNITFTTAPAAGRLISIVQKSHWRLIETIDATNSNTGDQFGHSIDIDATGRTIVVGAPYADIADSTSTVYTDAGEVYVYNNTVEAFAADGTSLTYNTTNTIDDGVIVTVDGTEFVNVTAVKLAGETVASTINHYSRSGNSITFSYAPAKDDIIRVWTGNYKQSQRIDQNIVSESPTAEENFGFDVAVNTYGSSIAIGCPGEDETNPNTGSVFVFTDTGLRFGTVNTETTLHSLDYFENETIFINDFEVTASADDTNIQQFIADVTNANIAGVSATNRNLATHQATISTTATTPNERLRIRPGTGALFDKVAVTPFVLTQKINHPSLFENENFGKKVAFDRHINANGVNTQNLVVSSDRSSTLLPVGFDKVTDTIDPDYNTYATTFDSNGTLFIDKETQSGAAYVYEFTSAPLESITNYPQYLFQQQLTANEIDELDEFGSAIAINDKRVLVGSRLDDEAATDAGSVYEFNTDTGIGWVKKRTQADKVDISLFNRVVTYNTEEQEIITFCDFLDPYKLKVAGVAQQEIDYFTDFDPAKYTSWNDEHIGRVWWDLNNALFIEYEQGELDYRTQYWGRLFPGATIDVYEWVESDVLPAQYTGEGTPRSTTNYSVAEQVNSLTNTTQTFYYFWVQGKESVPDLEFRSTSTAAVARAIENPIGSNIKHVQFVAPDAFNLVNLNTDLDSNKTAISINYDRIANDGVLHSEFELVSKGDPTQEIPSRIFEKIVDSCAGVDKAGNAVPTAELSVAERYGISIRPRQTIYKNRFKAMQVFVDYCNQQFANFPVIRQANINNFLFADDPQPTSVSGLWDKKVNTVDERDYLNPALFDTGYNILVTSDSTQNGRWSIYQLQSDNTWTRTSTQTYATTEQWSYRTWYAAGFDEFTVPLYQVDLETDLETLTDATVGELAKVLSNDDGNESSYQLQSNGTWREVIIGNGTVEFNTTLYTDFNAESTEYPADEVRNLFSAVKNDIFINDNALLMNELFFRMIEYSLDEYGTTHPDWVLKTSFIRVLHKLRDLAQYPTFRNDNSEFVETFINEVKPYKTKIRDYTTRFAGDDNFAGDVTDFDTHAFYDADLTLFRKPSGDYAGDEVVRTTGLNVPWSENYTYRIDEIEIYNGGTGYIVDPTLTISAPDVAGGVQATATAISNSSAIIAVNMTNKGSGYTTIPTITISGAAGTDLKLIPRLKNDAIREFDVTLKFDRITYSASVKDWTANTAYSLDDLVAHKNAAGIQEVYKVVVAFTSGTTFSAENASGTTVMTVYADETLASNADRIAAYYTPDAGMLGDDLNLLQIGTDYTGNRVSGLGFDQAPGFDSSGFARSGYDAFEIDTDGLEVLAGNLIDSNIRSTFSDSLLGTRPEDINVDGGKFVDVYNSHAPEEVVPGRVFDTLDLEVYTDPSDDFEYDGNGFKVVTRAYVGDGNTTTYSFKNTSASEDVDAVLVWVGTQRQYNATVNRTAGTITLSSAPAAGVGIFTYGYGLTGEKITHEQTFTGDGSTNFIIMGIGISQVVQEFVSKNGVTLVKDTDYTVTQADNRTIITLTATPAVDDHIHVLASSQDASRFAFTDTRTQAITLTSGVQTYTLDKEIEYVWPYEGAVVAELDNKRLRPTNAKHYTADGSTVTFSIPTSAGEGAVLDGDIRVSVISPDDRSTLFPTVNKSVNIDYTLDPSDGSSARIVTFFDPPSTGDTVIISVRTGAEYLVDGTTITLTSAAPSFTTGDVLHLTSFSNHNPVRPQTQVFIGLGSDTASDTELFDSSPFDTTGFDGTTIVGVALAKYTMDRAITNSSFLWVTLDGVKLHPGEYDIDENGKLDLTSQILTDTSEIIVTSFTENVIQPTVGFRIFKDMLGGYNYYRICDDESTLIAQDVSITDDKIYVEDASRLSDVTPSSKYPGVVFIGNERVTYWERNTTLNYITNLRRGTRGTRYAPIHRAGVAVIDASEDSRLPATDSHTKTWYDLGTGTPANGLGIQASTTVNAKYLKSCIAIVQNYTKELDSPKYITDGYVEEGYIEEQLI